MRKPKIVLRIGKKRNCSTMASRPPKTKGTAKMRLFEAVNKGNLNVPAPIIKVENDLKKEWTKREREAKQALKKQAGGSTTATTPAKTNGKRKADQGQLNDGTSVSININLSVGPNGNVVISSLAGPAAKKAKTTKVGTSR